MGILLIWARLHSLTLLGFSLSTICSLLVQRLPVACHFSSSLLCFLSFVGCASVLRCSAYVAVVPYSLQLPLRMVASRCLLVASSGYLSMLASSVFSVILVFIRFLHPYLLVVCVFCQHLGNLVPIQTHSAGVGAGAGA